MIPCSGLHRSQIIRNILTTNHSTNVNLHHYCRFTNKISLISANDILKFVNLSSFTLGNIWGVCVHLCTPMYAPWTYMLYVFVHIARLIEETCVCVWKYMHINRFTCTGKHTYTLSYYHHQIGSMDYYALFRVRSWNNGVRCMSFCILIYTQVWPIFLNIHSYICVLHV